MSTWSSPAEIRDQHEYSPDYLIWLEMIEKIAGPGCGYALSHNLLTTEIRFYETEKGQKLTLTKRHQRQLKKKRMVVKTVVIPHPPSPICHCCQDCPKCGPVCHCSQNSAKN